jgi:hypothetical protein
VLLAFSLGGLLFHKVPGPWYAELARIGLPYLLGYFSVARLLGADRRPQDGKFALRSVTAWALGIGLGVLLRVVVQGRIPATSFVVVTYAFTGLLLALWRGAYCWWTSPRQ